ncbi:MAG: AAA-like domain-containing protein [Nostoc sp.]
MSTTGCSVTHSHKKMQSMGLVKLAGNEVEPRCQLYRSYFGDMIGRYSIG